MEIEQLTIAQAKQLAAMFPGSVTTLKPHPYKVGKNYFIRTVTLYYVGRLTEVFDSELVLRNASWIPDTGRFHAAFESGVFNEVEPYPISEDVIINRGSIIDAAVWTGSLPTEAK